jgi:hypothetical protein
MSILVVFNPGYVYPWGYVKTSYGVYNIEEKIDLISFILDVNYRMRITCIIHQQLWG